MTIRITTWPQLIAERAAKANQPEAPAPKAKPKAVKKTAKPKASD